MNNKNYRVMKFFEPVDRKDKARGYVRLDIRGIKGTVIVSVENLGDVKTSSEVYLYKDRTNKIKLGDINNKKGMIKKILTFGSNNAIEDYNVCAIVKDKKIALYSNLFNTTSLDVIKKLDTEEVAKTSAAVEEKTKQQLKHQIMKEESKKSKESMKSIITEKAAPIEEIKKETKKEIHEEIIEEAIEEIVKETDEDTLEETFEASMEPDNNVHAVGKSCEDEPVDEKVHAESQTIRHKNKFNESLYNALKDYKKTEPLSVKIKNFNWWYIPYDETGIKNGFLPYYNQVVSSYYPYPMSNRVTTCNSLMKKYGHYIFGIYEDKDDIVKFIYGVPGEFTKEEQPYKGVTGFKNWSYSNKEDEKGHGYWLAFVNPRTGEATEPPNIVLTK